MVNVEEEVVEENMFDELSWKELELDWEGGSSNKHVLIEDWLVEKKDDGFACGVGKWEGLWEFDGGVEGGENSEGE